MPPCHVPPEITVEPKAKEFVPHCTFAGIYACTSHVPATVPFDKRAIAAAPPDVIVPTAPEALSTIVKVPVALLLNSNVVVLVSVVASGNLKV